MDDSEYDWHFCVLFDGWREVRNGKFRKCVSVGVGVDIGAVFWGVNPDFASHSVFMYPGGM